MIFFKKNRLTYPALFAFLVCFLLVQQAEARTVIRTGDNISIAEDQIIEGDFYTAANIINLSGKVDEDLVAAAADITLNGSVGDDVLIIAGRTDIHGTVGDDLRIISGEVTIAEAVAGDVFVIGGVVKILSTATVGGDVIVYAGQATIEGMVEGDIVGSIDELRIDGVVKGDVDVRVSDLTFGDRAAVTGTVRYVSHNVAVQSLNSTIEGELTRSDPALPVKDMTLKVALVPVLVLLFSILTWYLVSRKTLALLVDRATERSPRPILTGIIFILLAPLAASLLMVSMIGVLVGAAILLAYFLIMLLSIISFSAVLGKLLMKLFNKPRAELSLFNLTIGVLGVVLLVLLPVIGQLSLLALIILTFGTIVDLIIRPDAK